VASGDGEGIGVGVGDGDGDVVGIGTGFLGRTSRSFASATIRILVVLLYLPAAKILLPTEPSKLTLLGTSRVMASEEEVRR